METKKIKNILTWIAILTFFGYAIVKTGSTIYTAGSNGGFEDGYKQGVEDCLNYTQKGITPNFDKTI